MCAVKGAVSVPVGFGNKLMFTVSTDTSVANAKTEYVVC